MGYYIKWEYKDGEWKPKEIVKPERHEHLFDCRNERYFPIGIQPEDCKNEYTRWRNGEVIY